MLTGERIGEIIRQLPAMRCPLVQPVTEWKMRGFPPVSGRYGSAVELHDGAYGYSAGETFAVLL